MIPTPFTFYRTLATFGITLTLLALAPVDTEAANGTWTNLAAGSWTNATNWSGGTIADASGSIADFATLNLTADTTVTLDGARTIGSMIFGDTSPSHNWFLNTGSGGTLTLAGGSPTITVNNQTNTIGLVMAGTVGMTKAGSGTLILGGANTYTGGTTVNAGTLQIGSGGSGVVAAAPITNNSTLIYYRGDNTAITLPVTPTTGNGTLIFAGAANTLPADFRISATNTFTGPVFLNLARLYDNAGHPARFGSPSMINVGVGSAVLTGTAFTYTNPISIAGIGWRETTAPNFLGALRLATGCNWTGPITLTGNARINAHAAAAAVNAPIAGAFELELSGTSGTSTLTLGSPSNSTLATRINNFGTTLYVVVTNANALSTGPLTMIGGILRMPGVNMSFSNLASATSSSQLQNSDGGIPTTVTVGADNSSTTFAGMLLDGGNAALSLTKIGTGTLTLTGGSSHTGNTTVSNGMLLLQGASAGLNGSGSVTVNSGATFGDGGTVSGPIAVLSGGAIQASGLGGVSLTCGNSLTFGSAPGDSTSTRVNLGLGGKILAVNGLTVIGTNTINIIGGAPQPGVYDLFTYSGTIGGNGFAGFALGTTPAGMVATLQNSGTAVQLNVIVSGTEPKIWLGNLTGVWNPAAANEWLGTVTGLPRPYVEFDNVTFEDSATNFTVNLTTNVTPSTMVVSNVAHNVTLNGTGSIGGSVTLIKRGDATLTINNTNTFTAAPAINGGTLAVARLADGGIKSPLGAGSSVDFDGGTLQVNAVSASMNRNLNLNGNGSLGTANALTLSGAISGAGSLTKTGAGTVTLMTTTAHTGGTIINAGTLQVGDGTPFVGALNGGIENHGTLTYFRTEPSAEVTVAGSVSGDGAWNFLGTGVVLQGRYTLTGDNSAFTGPMTANNSRIQVAAQVRLGSATVTVTNGGSILINCPAPPAAALEFANPFVISGIGWLEGAIGAFANYGALRLINAVITGPVVMTADSRITTLSSATNGSWISGVISESGGSWKLEVGQKTANNAGGTLSLMASNTYTGGTDIRGAVLIAATNGCLGPGPITIDEGFAATHISRLDVIGGVTITNNITIDSTGQTGSRGAVQASNGVAVVSGNITITANVGNGGHFAADDITSSVLRISSPILTPTGIAPVIFTGTVEVSGGGTYTNLSHGGGTLRLAANNGINSGARLTLGTTTNSLFDLNGFNQALVGLIKGASNSTTTNSAGTASTLTLNVSGTNTYAGNLRGNLLLTLASGACTLSGANDYTGATAVNGGTLLVNGTNSGGGPVTVASGGRLGGTGAISGPITLQAGGTLVPGTSIGTLTASSNLTLSAGSTTVMEINADSVTGDKVVGVNTLSYGGTLTVTNTGGTFTNGQTYQLFSAASYVGNFSALNLPSPGSGLAWEWTPATGTLRVVAVATPSITAAFNGGVLQLNWPGSFLGWFAQSNSVSVANPTRWFDIPGSQAGTNLNITVDRTLPQVFYRLRSP